MDQRPHCIASCSECLSQPIVPPPAREQRGRQVVTRFVTRYVLSYFRQGRMVLQFTGELLAQSLHELRIPQPVSHMLLTQPRSTE
jgi:hypothetical protein